LVDDYKPKVKTRSRKKRWWYVNNVLRISIWISLGVSVVLVVLCAVAYVSSSRIFLVRSISIYGLSHTNKDQVLAILDLENGDNIFSWDMRSAKERLEKNPWIKSARISRRFIPASVKVTIREYMPIACTIFDNRRYLVSSEGKIFAVAPETYNGLMIRGIKNLPLSVRDECLKNVVNAVKLIEDKGGKVKSVDLSPGIRTAINIEGNNTFVFWGDIRLGEIKRAFIAMAKMQPAKGMIMDLGFDNKIVLRPLGKGA